MRVKKIPTIRKQVIGENLLYAIIWTAVVLVPFMNAGLMSESINSISAIFLSWLKILPFFLIFLINHWLLYPHLLQRGRYLFYLLISVILVPSIFMTLELYEQSEHIGVAWPFGPANMDVNREHISLTVFPWWGNIIAGWLMILANNIIRKMYESMQHDEDEARLQRQNIQAEMYYLKHQINPHFLMNTLNNINALIDIDSEAAKQAIIQLSNMLRYVVYDTGDNSIALKDDLKFIKNYIELMRIRYTEDVHITYSYPESLKERVDVPPLIFVVFVENAFKHGISYKSSSYIHIDVKYEDGYVTASFENSVNSESRKSTPGIGLENVRKRLDLIYNDRYDLLIEDRGSSYCVTLKIPTLNGDEMHSN